MPDGGVTALSGLRRRKLSVGLISAAHQAYCGHVLGTEDRALQLDWVLMLNEVMVMGEG
ncbi:hypothetical protein NI35_3138 [Salmonella enterica subsp. enterica serovar Cerro]|nr:hypothetical protein GW13_PRO0421 [Salmonella enterica subsp. enterica serovar Cerro]KMN25176.1 hypothetical protein NI35_3138 [Salmonella enterica subsp. enterica serovar Cerro]